MGVVGWMLLLLSSIMVPAASQKPPGLSVGVILGQTRPVSDQELRYPRRPEDALDVNVVTMKMNQTDPKSVITQVRAHIAVLCVLSVKHNSNLMKTRVGSLCLRCVSFCLALVFMALCLRMAPIRRP